MPVRAPSLRSCGCIVASGDRCRHMLAHDRERKARHDQNRPSASERGYDGKWQRESKAFLALPENRHCACGCGRPSDMVDHIIPHRGDKRLFWSRRNWQPMASSPCHSSRKQSQEKRR